MTPSSNPMRPQYGQDALSLIADMGRRAGKHAAAHVLSRSALPVVVAAQLPHHRALRLARRGEPLRVRPGAGPAHDRPGAICRPDHGGDHPRADSCRRSLSDTSGPIRRLDMRVSPANGKCSIPASRYTLHSDAGVRLTPIDRFDLGLRTAQVELRPDARRDPASRDAHRGRRHRTARSGHPGRGATGRPLWSWTATRCTDLPCLNEFAA